MAFESFAAFLSMEGHGPYVWSCYGVFFVLMIAMMVWSLRRRRAVLQACRRLYDSLDEPQRGAANRASATFTRVNVSQD